MIAQLIIQLPWEEGPAHWLQPMRLPQLTVSTGLPGAVGHLELTRRSLAARAWETPADSGLRVFRTPDTG